MTTKAMDSIAPVGDGTNPTTVGVGTLDATARLWPMPPGYGGNWLRVKPVGAAVRWVVTVVKQGVSAPTAAQMIDNTTAVAAEPPAFGAKIGEHVADGVEVERELPTVQPGETLYFAWQGLALGTFLQVEKGSGMPGTNLRA